MFRSESKFPDRMILKTLRHYRSKRGEQYTSAGILNGNGDDWWRIRSKSQQPFLKTKNGDHYVPVLGDIADEFIGRIWLIRQENNEMKPNFINEMYRWALECKFPFTKVQNILSLYFIVLFLAVAVVGLNTRLGCLQPNLAPDSEAQVNKLLVKIENDNYFSFSFRKWSKPSILHSL